MREGPTLSDSAHVFRAIGHVARLRILQMLRGGGLCVCQVTSVLELAPSTVSAHLAELRRAGLITERRDGRWVTYTLVDTSSVASLLDQVWALAGASSEVAGDARLLQELRKVPVAELCRAELDLSRLGLQPDGTEDSCTKQEAAR
jgi:ArsR family transcriptional regulator, arsenate/arsenite/antimonite-responsive transcriptional repressor